MHPAARQQFKRVMDEFVAWRAIADDERPPAPAWWWGPAFELRDIDSPLPAHWCGRLGLPDGATLRGRRKSAARGAGRPDAGAVAL